MRYPWRENQRRRSTRVPRTPRLTEESCPRDRSTRHCLATWTGLYARKVRIVVALGGNALIGSDGNATPEAQTDAVRGAAPALAGLAAEHELVITHGNGPQVGNILVKNEIAASVVPPVPLDWCGAQTQGTIGTLLLNAREEELTRRGIEKRIAALVPRPVVAPHAPGFQTPTKPIGRYLPLSEAQTLID